MAYIVASGRCTEPELSYSGDGTAICKFRVADSYWKGGARGQGGEEVTIWYQVVVFGDQATRLNERVTRGSIVEVAGELRPHEWQGQDSQTRYRLEIHWPRLKVLQRKSPEGQQGQGQGERPAEGPTTPGALPDPW